jgi:hypothetical protein
MPGVAPRGAVSTQRYAGVPSEVSFAQSVGATLIGDLAGDGEMGDHGPLLLMVVVCLRTTDGFGRSVGR